MQLVYGGGAGKYFNGGDVKVSIGSNSALWLATEQFQNAETSFFKADMQVRTHFTCTW